MNTEPTVLKEVSDAYENMLEVPSEKPAKQFVLCPVGPVGAGKTTVLKPLAARLSLVRICGDDIREMLKARGEGYDATFEIGTGLARKYLALGYSLALDSDCASPKTREFITAVETEYNLSVIWIHINPPEAFILHKLKNFKHTWLFRDADQAIENYEARKPLHEHLDLPFIYRFDTSKENLPEQIEEAALRIQQMVD